MSRASHTSKPPKLLRDLDALMQRRKVLGLMASGAAAPILYGSLSSQALAAVCTILPEETNGPYPADGSNTANGSLANVLVDSGLIREDIRESFGEFSGTAEGVPLELELVIADATNSCAPLAGYLIYIWHCTQDGQYSIYNLADQNYLRGAGIADENGKVKFTTIYPGCYNGRVPHIHFEVYPSAEAATSYEHRALCSQFAFPDETSSEVYTSVDGYADSISAFNAISMESDNVFGDNSDAEKEAMTLDLTGSIEDGFKGTLTIAIDPSAEPVLSSAPPSGGPGGPGGPGGTPPEGAPERQ